MEKNRSVSLGGWFMALVMAPLFACGVGLKHAGAGLKYAGAGLKAVAKKSKVPLHRVRTTKEADDLSPGAYFRNAYASIGRDIGDEAQGRHLLKETTRTALKARPSPVSPEEFPQLFREYPGLEEAMRDEETLAAFIKKNPDFLHETSLELYSKRPDLFATTLANNVSMNGLRDAVGNEVRRRNADTVEQLVSKVKANLEERGFPAEMLDGMDDEVKARILQEALGQEIGSLVKASPYTWEYKSGALSVKGRVGNFIFEQEISIRGLVKGAVIGVGLVKGYKIVSDTELVFQVNECVENFCIRMQRDPSMTGASQAVTPRGGAKINGVPRDMPEEAIGGMTFGSTSGDEPISRREALSPVKRVHVEGETRIGL